MRGQELPGENMQEMGQQPQPMTPEQTPQPMEGMQ